MLEARSWVRGAAAEAVVRMVCLTCVHDGGCVVVRGVGGQANGIMAAVDRSTVNIKVRVRFVAARNLKNVQMVGKQDPFIKAQLFGKEFKSATNNDGGKNPSACGAQARTPACAGAKV